MLAIARLLTLLAFGVGVVSPTLEIASSIDPMIEREMQASGVPGLAYAVVKDGELVAVRAHGVVDSRGAKEVTPDTPFLIGSISKSFTALAVMQLVEAGRVDLDAEISSYLDVFAGGPAASISIRQLLSHTSGYSTLQGNSSHTDESGEDVELARRVLLVAHERPAYPAGSRWAYSNANYQILGRLVEIVSGQSYQRYVKSKILDRIGMEHSFVSDGQRHDEMAMGHRPWFGSKRPIGSKVTHRSVAPQGGIVASANDLARYLQVMMNGRDDVLRAQGKAMMMRPASEVAPFYGLGWFVDSENESVWHSGNSPGFETLATIVQDKRDGVVVLVNASGGMGFGETAGLRNAITARYLGFDYEGEPSRWFQKSLFIGLVMLPLVFLFSTAWAWIHRAKLRAKSGAFGHFSLCFPLFTTMGMAIFVFGFLPYVAGASLETLALFQPDLGIVLIAAPITGVFWAVFRMVVGYSGRG